MVFGAGDYQLDLGVLEPTRPFTFALARIANAGARLRPRGHRRAAFRHRATRRDSRRRAASRSDADSKGKMAIHPSQVESANEVFSPPRSSSRGRARCSRPWTARGTQGRGAVKTRDGKMIDLVHIKIARKILERAP
jgi:citrate lyase beta subunit